MKFIRIVALFCLSFFLACTTAKMHFRKAEDMRAQEKFNEAIQYYIEAMNKNPSEARYRLKLLETTIEASNYYLRLALQHIQEGKYQLALVEINKALEYNPSNMLAQGEKRKILRMVSKAETEDEKTALEKLKDKTSLQNSLGLDKTRDVRIGQLRFEKDQDLDRIFQTLARIAGINILFDPNFKNSKLTVNLEDITFTQAIERLCLLKELFYKVLDERTILIIPDTAAKRKVYEEQIIKNFYLSNLNAEDCVKLIGKVTKISNITADPAQNSITVRDVPEKVALVERLINIYDKRKAEVLIKVEILEVNKDKLKEYGIEFSQYQVSQGMDTGEANKGIKGNRFYYLDSSDFAFTLPTVIYKLMENDSDSKVMARPHLRGADNEKMEIKLGDKVPVPRTTFMPFAQGGVEQHPITSFDLQDVGIEVTITPKIHHNAEISLELDFKLTFITSPGTTSIPPTIGNRSLKTKIRLRDGETGVIAGLLRDSERNSMKGFPGLIRIPILREIFSSNMRQITQTDIILSITPYIVRMPDIREEDLLPMDSGTEDNIHLKKK